jgi:hypothetical protein
MCVLYVLVLVCAGGAHIQKKHISHNMYKFI